MRQLTVRVDFDPRESDGRCEARVWRTGHTLCTTFYCYGVWGEVETFPIPPRERAWDLLTHARELWQGDTFTLANI